MDQNETHYLGNNFVFMPDYKDASTSEHLHLIVLSGLNSEGENIVFAVAIMQEIKYESFCWVLFHFK